MNPLLITTKSNSQGLKVGAVVQHADGRRHIILVDPAHSDHDLERAIAGASADLLAEPSPSPILVSGGLIWLGMVGRAGVTGEAARVASVLAQTDATDWLGLAEIGRPVGVSPKNTWRAINRLVAAGLLVRNREGGRCRYIRVAP